MPTPLKWVSTPSLGQGRASGGSAAAELFEAGTAQRKVIPSRQSAGMGNRPYTRSDGKSVYMIAREESDKANY